MFKNLTLGLCGLALMLLACDAATPTAPAAGTSAPTQIVAPTNTTLAPTAGSTAIVVSSATAAPTSTQAPTVTPVPTANTPLGLSLSQFFDGYNKQTDLQKKAYLGTVSGKTVSWSGNVLDVTGDGKIIVGAAGLSLDSVSLEDVSSDVAVTINKGATIKFTGTIDKAIDFLGMHVYLVNCQITK